MRAGPVYCILGRCLRLHSASLGEEQDQDVSMGWCTFCKTSHLQTRSCDCSTYVELWTPDAEGLGSRLARKVKECHLKLLLELAIKWLSFSRPHSLLVAAYTAAGWTMVM